MATLARFIDECFPYRITKTKDDEERINILTDLVGFLKKVRKFPAEKFKFWNISSLFDVVSQIQRKNDVDPLVSHIY